MSSAPLASVLTLTPGGVRKFIFEGLILSIHYDTPKAPTAKKRIWISVKPVCRPSKNENEAGIPRWIQAAAILSKRTGRIHFEEDKDFV